MKSLRKVWTRFGAHTVYHPVHRVPDNRSAPCYDSPNDALYYDQRCALRAPRCSAALRPVVAKWLIAVTSRCMQEPCQISVYCVYSIHVACCVSPADGTRHALRALHGTRYAQQLLYCARGYAAYILDTGFVYSRALNIGMNPALCKSRAMHLVPIAYCVIVTHL
jgi:hypothetical protein